jgi:hypothetical protein
MQALKNVGWAILGIGILATFRRKNLPADMAPIDDRAMFMLEVVWIFFLVYAFVRLVLPGGR